ncbi:HAD hydrolase-like protein [Eggerthia catenaformis]|uniref:HAD hydrolase-like protein n=1 Tax=Eggerthia catenaformis TaxID=31973 RepID=UPI0028E61DF4|nr:HAD hydrolase-like protein [Eggerthia catenaformis]
METVLFDLDGTLTDSGEGIIKSADIALKHFNIHATQEQLKVFVGPPLIETFRMFGIQENSLDEAVKLFRKRYLTVGKFENHPYQGIENVLRTLKEKNHNLFVATSKPEKIAIEILDHYELSPYFTKICGATMDEKRSSKDDVISYLKTHIDTDKMLMIGDTIYDVLGANVHSIPTIGVSWGYGNPKEMKKAGAITIVHTPEELLDEIISFK